jgi:phage-related holin
MKEVYSKLFTIVSVTLITFFTPISKDLFFVGSLVIADWITGMAKGVKESNFKSSIAIRKFWVSVGYFIGIIISVIVQNYFGGEIPLLKAVITIIAVSELQSLRENIISLNGVDILKPIINLVRKIKKNGN